MDDRKLKEYAYKIFQGISGYSLNKAFSLFPKYYPKIAFYYSLLLTNKQKELTTRAIQAIGITKATNIRKIAIETSRKLEQFTACVIYKIKALDIYERGFIDEVELLNYKAETFNKYSKILDDVITLCKANGKAFNSVAKEAKKYGYNDIYVEAMHYLKNNYNFLYEVTDAAEYYRKRIEEYQIDI